MPMSEFGLNLPVRLGKAARGQCDIIVVVTDPLY